MGWTHSPSFFFFLIFLGFLIFYPPDLFRSYSASGSVLWRSYLSRRSLSSLIVSGLEYGHGYLFIDLRMPVTAVPLLQRPLRFNRTCCSSHFCTIIFLIFPFSGWEGCRPFQCKDGNDRKVKIVCTEVMRAQVCDRELFFQGREALGSLGIGFYKEK